MKKPITVIKTSYKDYKGLISLGCRVAKQMDTNPNFSDPSPSLLTLQDAVTDAMLAAAKWGEAGNRGSHADRLALQKESVRLAQLLKAMSQYVQNTAQLAAGNDYVQMATIMESSGFPLKRVKAPQGKLDQVQDLRRMIVTGLNQNKVKLKWKKPQNMMSYNCVKTYKIYRSATGSFDDAALIAAVSKTSFIDTNAAPDVVTWSYWIVPVSAAGDGAMSMPLHVTVVGTKAF